MISFEEARQRILEAVSPLAAATVPLDDTPGCVLAGPVTAPHAVPPFDNSAMDGFAVRAVDIPGTLRIVGDLPAGSPAEGEVGPGEAIRIMTGAPLPRGADAVAQVEITSADRDRVTVREGRQAGTAVRRAGEDVAAGSQLFDRGMEVTPSLLGSLATIGLDQVTVVRRPKVAVLSTGDELREVGEPLAPGLIHDSNRHALLAALRDGGFETVDGGIVGDDEAQLEKAVREAVNACDALVTSGGVSVGDYDFVKAVLSRLGEVEFWQVAQRPAKPLAFGLIDGTPVFGLPGNPVSALVSFEELARPALRKMAGHRLLFRPEVEAEAGDDLIGPADLLVFLRVVVAGGVVRLAGGQGSHVLTALAAANAFALLPVGTERIGRGEGVTCRMIHLPEDR